MVVQWLRLRAPNVGGLGSTPGQGARSHRLQLRPSAAKYINNIYIFLIKRKRKQEKEMWLIKGERDCV